MAEFSIYNFSAFLVLLLILCSLLGNARDVTAKQMDGAVPKIRTLASNRYQHAACCFRHRFAHLM
jgi:hypothetical protein